MPRFKSTIFCPLQGSAYIVINTKTNEKTVCHVLKPSDSKVYGPVRSGRACKKGGEFFKVFINEKVYKMNNSLMNGSCLSEDKVWEFTGEKPSFKARRASGSKDKKQKKSGKMAKVAKPKDIEFVSHSALSKII